MSQSPIGVLRGKRVGLTLTAGEWADILMNLNRSLEGQPPENEACSLRESRRVLGTALHERRAIRKLAEAYAVRESANA